MSKSANKKTKELTTKVFCTSSDIPDMLTKTITTISQATFHAQA